MERITCPSCKAVIAEDGTAIFQASPDKQKLDEILADCNIIRDDLKTELAEVKKYKAELVQAIKEEEETHEPEAGTGKKGFFTG